MNSKQDNQRRRALAALASMSAGLMAAALAIYTQANPRAFTSETVSVNEGDMTSPLTFGATPPVLPRIEGSAVPNHMSGSPAANPLHSHSAVRHRSGPSCVPYWRELESGPVGRHVLVTCPGAETPPPPPTALGGSRGDQLPSLGTLAGWISTQRLPDSFLPGHEQALLAARQVDSSLRRRWRDATQESGANDAGTRTLPLANSLSWEPLIEPGS